MMRAHPALSICAVLFAGFVAAFPWRALSALDDALPRGQWVERQSGLLLEIDSKNTVRFVSNEHTTLIEIVFAPEARVRDEYWMAIKSYKEIEHKLPEAGQKSEKAAAPAKPDAGQNPPAKNADQTKDEQQTQQTEQKAAAPIPRGPLRLDWLQNDAKMILSFLIERPPPEKPAKKEEKEAAKSEKNEQSKDKPAPPKKEKPKKIGPRPILELLIFRDGMLVRELIFDRPEK